MSAGNTITAAPIASVASTVVDKLVNVPFVSQAPQGMASTFSGTYSEYVFRDSVNTLCKSAGYCLTFAIQVSNAASSVDELLTATAGHFSSDFTYEVGYVAVSGGVAPALIRDNTFGTLGFMFMTPSSMSNTIAPGMTSDYLVIQTSATNYAAASLSWQGLQTATVAGFAPAAAITPEPSSLALLGTGMLAIGGVLRRRGR